MTTTVFGENTTKAHDLCSLAHAQRRWVAEQEKRKLERPILINVLEAI